MKKYKYLVVNGCSFVNGGPMLADYEFDYPESTRYSELTSGERKHFKMTHRFSKLLSDRLGCEEINLAKQGGSNDRIFRTTVHIVVIVFIIQMQMTIKYYHHYYTNI